MNDILAKAQELGKAVAASERFKALEAARSAAQTDEALQADLKALQELTRKTAQLEKEIKPVEPEDKRRIKELQEKVTRSPRLQEMARVEADFAELMNRVNKAIQSQFAKQPTEADAQ